jgi:hypothetical protein
MKQKLKSDKFRTARGGSARVLDLYCRLCNAHVLKYQKDGPGTIYRLYFDRIISPNNLVNLQNNVLKDILVLRCPLCNEILGTPYIYKSEKRKCFRLYSGALIKNKKL